MPFNVLIVDDSAVMRSMIVKTLALAGIPVGDVHEASNGKEGLEALERNWIDLVLADINMPVMNGEEMINHIRGNPLWGDLPIVVISTEGSRTRIERLGLKDISFIHKPFTPESLRDVVRGLVGASHEQV